jgi:hypothetical protein
VFPTGSLSDPRGTFITSSCYLYSHYVRHDFSTATKLLEISKELKQRYGSLGNLLRQEKNRKDLEMRLQEFRGIGPVTTRIFLRELKKWLKSRI